MYVSRVMDKMTVARHLNYTEDMYVFMQKYSPPEFQKRFLTIMCHTYNIHSHI